MIFYTRIRDSFNRLKGGFFSPKGRVNRLDILIFYIIFTILFYFFEELDGYFNLSESTINFYKGFTLLFFIPELFFYKKRLNDIGLSIFFIVPFLIFQALEMVWFYANPSLDYLFILTGKKINDPYDLLVYILLIILLSLPDMYLLLKKGQKGPNKFGLEPGK